ncbi:MAG: DUF368 domain-containing protein [Clostridium sp.]|nr:DUF368 domain-containing protein [Clostridium sp.]
MNRNREHIITVLKGMWIGGTMTVPGVSGGSMAMILGIYDRLIASVSSFFKYPRRSMAFLATFLLGAGVGMVLFSRFISFLFTTSADVPLRFFFLGAVAGGVPMIYKEAGVRRLDAPAVVYPSIGIMAVVILSLLPTGMFAPDTGFGPGSILMQLAGGIIIAVGLVLPGISVSQMLYMLGIYELIIGNLSTLNILPLIPLGIGAAGGIFLTTKILEGLMRRYPQPTYLIILGFMLGSLPELFPGIPEGMEFVYSLAAAAAGFTALYLMAGRERKTLI